MTSVLRKAVVVPLPNDEEVTVEVTMRVIEIIERVWDKSLDAVISDLTSGANVKRSLVAEVIAQWVVPGTASLSRRELKEAIMRSEAEKFGVYAGLVWSAAMYSVRYIDEDSFDKAMSGITGVLKGSKKPEPEQSTAAERPAKTGARPRKKAGGRRGSQSKPSTSL